MEHERLEEAVNRHFQSDADADRNLYFKTYYSNKPVASVDFDEFFSERVTNENIDIVERDEEEVVIQAGGKKIVIFALPYDNWLLIYTSALPGQIRKNLGRLSDRVGWLTDAWVPSDTVESLYANYSQQRDKVRIKRRWDPYYLYQHFSTVPPEMQEFYENNLTAFEEQETEFSLRTPRWMVDEILDTKLTDDFLQRSEVAESRFNVHLSNPGEAGVTVEQSGKVTHRSGTPDATLKVVGEVLGKDEELHAQFEDVVPEREYDYTDSGMVSIKSYDPPKILRLRFPESDYNEEASIKLSNLLTVGQSDAQFHGFVSGRDGLEFRCHTYNVFDRSEYEIIFTGHEGDPTLYVRPIQASVDGVIYLYRTLKSKFDTTIKRDTLDETEFPEG